MRAHLAPGFVEVMNWGMICYEIPLSVSGKTYNGKPLMYAAIGAQKGHVGLYLCGVNCKPSLKATFEGLYLASGRKLDMGKACLRIKSEQDIDRKAVAMAISAMTVDEYLDVSHR